jgi:hypothetical protein
LSDNSPISEQYRIVAKRWVDAEAAASLMEDTKSAVLSQKMKALGDMPNSRAEMIVKASPEWMEFITQTIDTRKQANLLKVQLEYLRMRSKEWAAEEYARAAEMKL